MLPGKRLSACHHAGSQVVGRKGAIFYFPLEVKASGLDSQIAAFGNLDLRRVMYRVNTKAGLVIVVYACNTGNLRG